MKYKCMTVFILYGYEFHSDSSLKLFVIPKGSVECKCTIQYFISIKVLQWLFYCRYLQHIREVPTGGGFNSSMACQRALQEAFSCLLMNSNLKSDIQTSHDPV